MPSAGRYNLSALGQALGVLLPATHRALDDARVTRAIFHRLYEMTLELPLNLLAEIVRHGEQVDWAGYRPFYEALRSRSKETVSCAPGSSNPPGQSSKAMIPATFPYCSLTSSSMPSIPMRSPLS